jgi:hypothetical protein
MLRPTPGRLLYLLVGLVIGGVVLLGYVTVAGMPTGLPTLHATTGPTVGGGEVSFAGTTLQRVLMVNQGATKHEGVLGSVRVRVNALEEFNDGFSLTYTVLSGQPGQPASVLQPDAFSVVDDRGAVYRLSALGSTESVGPGLSTGYLAFTPALDPQARTLTVTLSHLTVVGGNLTTDTPRILDGPWQIQIPLQ